MSIHLPNARFVLSPEQSKRVEAAASKLPAERREAFRARVRQAARTPMGRGKVSDADCGVAISVALREFSRQPR
jgi:hypothetical protein